GGGPRGDGEAPFGVFRREVLGLHPRHVHVDDDVLGRLVDVGGRLPLGRADESDGPPMGDLVEIDLQLVGEVHRERAGALGGAVGAVSHGRQDNAGSGAPRQRLQIVVGFLVLVFSEVFIVLEILVQVLFPVLVVLFLQLLIHFFVRRVLHHPLLELVWFGSGGGALGQLPQAGPRRRRPAPPGRRPLLPPV